jgi:putative ABC transport system ATP-binding protein
LFILLPTTAMTDSMAAMPPDSSAAGIRPARGAAGELLAEALGKRVRLPDHELTILEDVGFRSARARPWRSSAPPVRARARCYRCWPGWTCPAPARAARRRRLSELDEDGRARIRGAKVGFVFQSFQLLPALTALENVMLPLELRGDRDAAGPRRDPRRVGLGERLEHYPRQLSGGEQQRVALARAFVTGPPCCSPTNPPATSTPKPAAR